MKNTTIQEVIEDLRDGAEDGVNALLTRILAQKDFYDKMDVLGEAIADGSCSEWESALRFASLLESILEEEE